MNDLDLVQKEITMLTRLVETLVKHDAEIMRELTAVKSRLALLEERLEGVSIEEL